MEFHIVLSPDDRERLGAPDPLIYDPRRFLVSEATALYKSAGLTRTAMNTALKGGDPEGRKAVTWIALRRAGVQVRYSELDFDLVGWVLLAPAGTDDDQAAADGDGDSGGDEGNSGALPSEGPTPQP